MLTKHFIRYKPVLAQSNQLHGTLTTAKSCCSVVSALTRHHCHHRRQEHVCIQCDNFLPSGNVLRGVPIVCFVQWKLFCSLNYLNNKYLQSGKTLRKLFSRRNVCDVSSFHPSVFQLSCGRSLCFTDLHLSVAGELIFSFSNTKIASRMEAETLVVASDVCMETLKIDSSVAEDSNDSSVPEDLGFSLGNRSDLVELAVVGHVADLGDAVLHKDARDAGAGLEVNATETEDATKVIEISSREADDVEVSVVVTEVTDKVADDGRTETKTSNSVLEFDGKITDDSQRSNLCGDETLAVSNLTDTGDRESKESNTENATSPARANRYTEKLRQFKAKLASNQTVLPPELLLKVSHLAARRHVEGDAERLTAEYLDQPIVEFVEGVQQPQGDWQHEMETIFMSYFDEADGESSTSKSRKEKERKEKKSGEKMASDRPKRVEPSHFIAIQITNSEIHEKMADIQKSVVTKKRILENALVNLPTLHITLMVLYLKDNEQIERAKTALEVSKTRVLELGKDLAALPFAGIGDFNGKVVFAKVQEGPELDQLKDIAETVRKSFEEQDLFSTDPKGFQAHLTIMKLSKCPWLFKKGVRKINPDFYVKQKDDYFGSQPIQSLQLCAMKKAENGYYPVDHEVFFESEIGNK